MSDRYGAFSVYYPARHTYYSGHWRGGPDEGQGVDLSEGWDPFEVLQRNAGDGADCEGAA